MMTKQKRAKNTHNYDEINQQVNRVCKLAKYNYPEEQCQEIKDLEKQHLTIKAWRDPESSESYKNTQTTGIMDKPDNIHFEKRSTNKHMGRVRAGTK